MKRDWFLARSATAVRDDRSGTHGAPHFADQTVPLAAAVSAGVPAVCDAESKVCFPISDFPQSRRLMHNLRSCSVIFAIHLVGVLGTGPALAAGWDPSEAEKAMLPGWCEWAGAPRHGSAAMAEIKDPRIRARLAALARSGCDGMWHYCWALTGIDRTDAALAANPANARGLFGLGVAIDNFQFVLKASEKSCSLFPDIYTKIGELQTRRGEYRPAEASFREALKIKPGFPPAFNGLSDLYESQEKPEQAIAILEAGIKANPGSSGLKKKLARLRARTTGASAAP